MSYPSCDDRARMKLVKVYQMEEIGDFEQGPVQGEKEHQQDNQNHFSWDTCGDPKWPIIFWVQNSKGVFEFPSHSAPLVQFAAPSGLS